jgi:hypothetical protein
MKIFVDENVSKALCSPLESLFKAHRFRSSEREGLLGVWDIPLFEELAERGFGAIITLDSQQLERPAERDGLRRAGLHWIGMASPPGAGLAVIGGLAAVIMGGLPHVLDDWRETPHIYRLSASVLESSRPAIEVL